MYMRASEASELRNFWYFHILKLLFPSIFCCWYILQILSQKQVSNNINAVSFYYLWYGACYI